MVPAHKARAHTMQGQQVHLLRCFDHHEAHGWSLHGSAIASAGDDITDRDTDLGVAGEREAAAGAVDRYQNRVEPDCLVFIDKAKTWRLPSRPKPRALSPQPASRSCCSIAFSRFLRARSMALASLGEILPVVMSVSILH